MHEFNYVLNKQQFQDSIRQRHRRSISGLSLSCSCGEGFNIQRNIFYKKGGFITLRHYEVKYITATILLDVCKDVELNTFLLTTLNGEKQTLKKTAKTTDEVRLDICALDFWLRSPKAFCDVSAFDPNPRKYSKQTLKQGCCLRKYEKKRHYNIRITEVDQGNFTALVFGGFNISIRS